jgi:hypothetical protein
MSEHMAGMVVPIGPVDREPRGRLDQVGREAVLCEALTAASVELGAYDQRILGWLAGWEPATVVVVVSWLRRTAGNWP